MVFHQLWPNIQKTLGPTTSGGFIDVNNCLIWCSTAHKSYKSTFVPHSLLNWRTVHCYLLLNIRKDSVGSCGIYTREVVSKKVASFRALNITKRDTGECVVSAKGQLISKCPFVVFKFSKKLSKSKKIRAHYTINWMILFSLS